MLRQRHVRRPVGRSAPARACRRSGRPGSSGCRSSRRRPSAGRRGRGRPAGRARHPGRTRRPRASSVPATPPGASTRRSAIDDSSIERVADLQVPGRRDRLHQALQRLAAGPVQEAVERLENRQVGFGAGQPLRAAAARDDRALGPGVSSARKSSTRLVLPMPASPETPRIRLLSVRDARIRAPKVGALGLAADGRADAGAARARLRQRLAPLQRGELLVDLARRRTALGFLRQHPVHERVERRRHRRIEPRRAAPAARRESPRARRRSSAPRTAGGRPPSRRARRRARTRRPPGPPASPRACSGRHVGGGAEHACPARCPWLTRVDRSAAR